jgi:hypothetical protein
LHLSGSSDNLSPENKEQHSWRDSVKRLRQTPEKLESKHKTISFAAYKNYREGHGNLLMLSIAVGVPFLHPKSLLNDD